jgi:glycosyltransferase involved in cell wall biosynthesis
VDVLTMAFRGLPRREEHGRLRVFRVPSFRRAAHICHGREMLTYLLPAFLKGMQLLRSQRYDLVHSHFLFPSGVVASWLQQASGVPYVLTAHGSDVPGYNPERFQMAHRLLAPAWRSVVKGATAVTCPSRWLAERIQAHAPGARVEIVPNGIDAHWLEPAEKSRTILVVSRLFERKGVQFLLEALQEFRTGWNVHIVGDGPYRGRIEAMARRVRDKVVFHGWLENDAPALKELYATAGIFVFPSQVENFPMCLLEAMLAGTAIVASDIAPCREVLGQAASFFRSGDVGSLRTLLYELVFDPQARQDWGRRARARLLERFVWPRVGEQYEAVFAAVAPATVPQAA